MTKAAPSLPYRPFVKENLDLLEAGDWKGRLLKSITGRYQNCGHNVEVILTHDPDISETLRFNEVTKEIDACGGPCADVPAGDIPTRVANWLQLTHGITVGAEVIKANILLVARQHSYNPVADHLRELGGWDNWPRIDTWLIDYCNAKTTNDDGEDISDIVRDLGAKFLIGLVARALRPGCQVDTTLILEGAQGIKKSSMFRVLAGEWYSDGQLNLGDKDSRLLAAQSWIVELAELTSIKKGDLDTVKAFLTQRNDKFRPPYGATIETFPRRCVFVGTVNPDGEYLVDRTGNRRFWPIRCADDADFDLEGLKRVRHQLLAEAIVRFEDDERWWLEREEEKRLDRLITSSRVEKTTTDVAAIEAWWSTLTTKPHEVTMHEVVKGAFGHLADRPLARGDATRIGRALSDAGFDKRRPRDADGKQRVFYEPVKVRERKATSARKLAVVAGAAVR